MDRNFAQQTSTITDMRKDAEQEATRRRLDMERAAQEENLLLVRLLRHLQIKEKQEREAKARADKNSADAKEIAFTTGNDFMTENPATCVSAMSATRVKKDHWKGMSYEQKKQILDEMAAQANDAKRKRELEKEIERLWAEQEEAKRQLLIREELEKQRRQRDMLQALKETHKVQKAEKVAKWPNYYGDKLPLDKPTS
jgi:hypothetical protein